MRQLLGERVEGEAVGDTEGETVLGERVEGEAVGDTDGETVLGERVEGDTLGESVGVDVMSVSPSSSVSALLSVSAPTRYACNPPPNHLACWPNLTGRSRVLDERARFRSMSVNTVARAVVRS